VGGGGKTPKNSPYCLHGGIIKFDKKERNAEGWAVFHGLLNSVESPKEIKRTKGGLLRLRFPDDRGGHWEEWFKGGS